MEWVESNPIPWTPYGLFIGWQPSQFFIPYPLWIPWNSPYGFHGRIHIKFHGKTTNCVVKNSANSKNRTVDSTTRHMHGRRCDLTDEPYDCYKITYCPLLIMLWVGHAQSERWQMPMLDLGAINIHNVLSQPPRSSKQLPQQHQQHGAIRR